MVETKQQNPKESNKVTEAPAKLTYEQLTEVCNNLGQRLQEAKKIINQFETNQVYERTSFLFNMLQNKECFSIEILSKVVKDINIIMGYVEPVNDSTKGE